MKRNLKHIAAELIDAIPGILFWASWWFIVINRLDVATWLLVLSLYFRKTNIESP